MNITKEDIASRDKIGDSPKGEVYHFKLKGGANVIALKKPSGVYEMLSLASHRAFAIHQASQVHKNIQWNDSLMKSEDMKEAMKLTQQPLEKNTDSMGNPIYESTPQNHYDLASHHSKMAGRAREQERALKATPNADFNALHDSRMRQLMHSDIALKHYEMSGLNGSGAKREHEKHMDLHHELKDEKSPFQEHALQLAFQRANPDKRAPRGLGNWSE